MASALYIPYVKVREYRKCRVTQIDPFAKIYNRSIRERYIYGKRYSGVYSHISIYHFSLTSKILNLIGSDSERTFLLLAFYIQHKFTDLLLFSESPPC